MSKGEEAEDEIEPSTRREHVDLRVLLQENQEGSQGGPQELSWW